MYVDVSYVYVNDWNVPKKWKKNFFGGGGGGGVVVVYHVCVCVCIQMKEKSSFDSFHKITNKKNKYKIIVAIIHSVFFFGIIISFVVVLRLERL